MWALPYDRIQSCAVSDTVSPLQLCRVPALESDLDLTPGTVIYGLGNLRTGHLTSHFIYKLAIIMPTSKDCHDNSVQIYVYRYKIYRNILINMYVFIQLFITHLANCLAHW